MVKKGAKKEVPVIKAFETDKKEEPKKQLPKFSFLPVIGVLVIIVLAIVVMKAPKQNVIQESLKESDNLQPSQEVQKQETPKEIPKQETPTPQPPTEEPIIEEPPAIPEQPIVVEKPVIVEPTILPSNQTLSQAKCVDGYISLVITNTFTQSFDIADIGWWITGKQYSNIVCDKETLNPGESTLCPQLNYYKMGSKRLVTANILIKSFSTTVDCGKYTGA